MRGEAPRRHRHDGGAGRQPLHAETDGGDDTRALAAERARVSRVEPEAAQHVLEVQADRPDLDLDLTGPGRTASLRPELEAIEHARRRGDDAERVLAGRVAPLGGEPGETRHVADPVAVRDLALGVAREQLGRHEIRGRRPVGRVQVEAAGAQLRVLERDRPRQPQHGRLRHRHRALVHGLRASRQDRERRGGDAAASGQGLREEQQTAAALALGGVDLGAAPVGRRIERRAVHDAAPASAITRALGDDPCEVLAPPGAHRPPTGCERAAGPAGGGEHDRLPLALERRGQRLAEAGAVGEHEPRRRRGLARRRGHDHRVGRERPADRRRRRDRARLGDTETGQHRAPLRRRQQRRVCAEVVIGEVPPAVGQPEGDVDPALGRGDLEQHQQATRREQPQAVGERPPEVAGRMHHVGGEDQIEAPRLQPLLERITLQVERLRPHERPVAEPLGGARGERRRDVGEQVVGAISGKHRQHGRRGAAGAAADLEHAQAPRRGEPGTCRRHRGCHQLPARAGRRRVRVERLRHRGRAAGEQQVERIGAARQHLGERAAAPLRERQLGARLRVAPAQRLEPRPRGRGRQAADHRPLLPRATHDADLSEDLEEAAEQLAIARAGRRGARRARPRSPARPPPATIRGAPARRRHSRRRSPPAPGSSRRRRRDRRGPGRAPAPE